MNELVRNPRYMIQLGSGHDSFNHAVDVSRLIIPPALVWAIRGVFTTDIGGIAISVKCVGRSDLRKWVSTHSQQGHGLVMNTGTLLKRMFHLQCPYIACGFYTLAFTWGVSTWHNSNCWGGWKVNPPSGIKKGVLNMQNSHFDRIVSYILEVSRGQNWNFLWEKKLPAASRRLLNIRSTFHELRNQSRWNYKLFSLQHHLLGRCPRWRLLTEVNFCQQDYHVRDRPDKNIPWLFTTPGPPSIEDLIRVHHNNTVSLNGVERLGTMWVCTCMGSLTVHISEGLWRDWQQNFEQDLLAVNFLKLGPILISPDGDQIYGLDVTLY